jgi:uncharacterized MAPEG superfamily protein
LELNKVGLQNFYSRRGASGKPRPTAALFAASYVFERRAKEKADNRANAFELIIENIKRVSNACIIVSDIIKKNIKGNILDKMMCGLYTYFCFYLIFSSFYSQMTSTIRRSLFGVSCLMCVQLLFLT